MRADVDEYDTETEEFVSDFEGYIVKHYGVRCSTPDETCATCKMWRLFDKTKSIAVMDIVEKLRRLPPPPKCEHGIRIGRCDTCGLTAAETRIAELEARNATLRAAMMDVVNTLTNTLTRTVTIK